MNGHVWAGYRPQSAQSYTQDRLEDFRWLTTEVGMSTATAGERDQIAARLGMTRLAMEQMLRRHGVHWGQPAPRRPVAATIGEYLFLKDQGCSIEDAARRLGYEHVQSLRRILKEAGIL